jgi:hypothetical protein
MMRLAASQLHASQVARAPPRGTAYLQHSKDECAGKEQHGQQRSLPPGLAKQQLQRVGRCKSACNIALLLPLLKVLWRAAAAAASLVLCAAELWAAASDPAAGVAGLSCCLLEVLRLEQRIKCG